MSHSDCQLLFEAGKALVEKSSLARYSGPYFVVRSLISQGRERRRLSLSEGNIRARIQRRGRGIAAWRPPTAIR